MYVKKWRKHSYICCILYFTKWKSHLDCFRFFFHGKHLYDVCFIWIKEQVSDKRNINPNKIYSLISLSFSSRSFCSLFYLLIYYHINISYDVLLGICKTIMYSHFYFKPPPPYKCKNMAHFVNTIIPEVAVYPCWYDVFSSPSMITSYQHYRASSNTLTQTHIFTPINSK